MLPLRDLGHARREREIVGRMLEQRIVKQLHLMEVDVAFAAGEPERRGRRDEMDIVAARRELDAELGRDDAGAAVGWVTGDADLEWQLAAIQSS